MPHGLWFTSVWVKDHKENDMHRYPPIDDDWDDEDDDDSEVDLGGES